MKYEKQVRKKEGKKYIKKERSGVWWKFINFDGYFSEIKLKSCQVWTNWPYIVKKKKILYIKSNKCGLGFCT